MTTTRRYIWCFATVAISLVLLLGFHFVNFGNKIVNPTDNPIILHISKGSNARQLVFSLNHPKQVVSTKTALTWMKVFGYSSEIKPGYYTIYPEETFKHFLSRVVNNNVLTKTFTVVEGTTRDIVSEQFSKAQFLDYKIEDWAKVAPQYASKEGLLLSETYQYDAGSDALSLMTQANNRLKSALQTAWQTRNTLVPYKNPYELLIAASIIEKEGKTSSDKFLISGVIMNRLNKNMPLQMDATIVYALGKSFTGTLIKKDLQIASPYNTYIHYGLPPTPIAMVGKEAIDAAAHPTVSKYLYYVTKGDGAHEFSESYNQQLKAIHRYHHQGNAHHGA